MPTYFSESFAEEAATLSCAAYRVHVTALCLSGERLLDQRISKRYFGQISLPDDDPASGAHRSIEAVAELVRLGWWADEGDAWDISIRGDGLWRQPAKAVIEHHRAGNRDRTARKRSGINDQVFERDGYKCVYCGADFDLTVDHIHPRIRGGSLELWNLQTLCRRCNSSKGATVVEGQPGT